MASSRGFLNIQSLNELTSEKPACPQAATMRTTLSRMSCAGRAAVPASSSPRLAADQPLTSERMCAETGATMSSCSYGSERAERLRKSAVISRSVVAQLVP